MARWMATFVATVLGGFSVLLALWGIGLILFPHEGIHLEYAIPALVLALVGALIAVVLFRRST